MNKITEPEPKCPNCGSYNVFPIRPKKKLTDPWKAYCTDCGHKANLDMFHYPDPGQLLNSIYDD